VPLTAANANRGCRVNANFTSTNVLIAPALANRKLTLLTNAMAREVLMDASGRATGVAYVDKATGADRRVRAKVVVLAASALETSRLLLNSKSSRFRNGLANSSGNRRQVHHRHDRHGRRRVHPKMTDHVPHNHDGVGGMHLYMPWWLDNAKLDFPRGYHIEIWGGPHLPSYDVLDGIQATRPGAATASSSRTTTAAPTAPRSASRAAAK